MVIVELLKSGFKKKQNRNPRYSLRALSRDSGIDVGMLSKIFSGKLLPAAETASRLCKGLGLSDDETAVLVNALSHAKFCKTDGAKSIGAATSNGDLPRELEESVFDVISSPHHYALLELTLVVGFKSEVSWIAKRLGITNLETEYAIHRLLKLGLLEDRSGVLIKTNGSITTKDKSKTSASHRAHQRALLKSAQRAIEAIPIEQRHNSGMTMAIDPAKIPAAKQLIYEFNRKLSELLETGDRQAVYQLSISLFPLEGMLS
jgi:uncharacterized protein (TIGR02147 family)